MAVGLPSAPLRPLIVKDTFVLKTMRRYLEDGGPTVTLGQVGWIFSFVFYNMSLGVVL